MLSVLKFVVLLAHMICASQAQLNATCTKCAVKEDRYPRLLIFVSFSMPMATLKQLNLQAQEFGGKLVFRGLIQSSFKETLPKLKELGAEVLIDPTLFRTYKIDKVPAFVSGEPEQHDILFGNVSVRYALEQFKGLP